MNSKKKTTCPFPYVPATRAGKAEDIVPNGDIILHVQDSRAGLNIKYRCLTSDLQAASSYFGILLDPSKFAEGKKFQSDSAALGRQFGSDPIPAEYLPVIVVKDAGDLPQVDGHCEPALTEFFRFLHATSKETWEDDRAHGLQMLTLLCLIADRFSAVDHVAKILTDNGWRERYTVLRNVGAEQSIRQKILIGLLMGWNTSVQLYSAKLICNGSKVWRKSPHENGEALDPANIWWRLPHGLEEEMECRHHYVLETLVSVPKSFVQLYTTVPRQCKLFYDNSPQCDSFQLGEMVRFMSRKSLLGVEVPFAPATAVYEPPDSAEEMVTRLRQCPSYQIDRHHVHCGLRTRMLLASRPG